MDVGRAAVGFKKNRTWIRPIQCRRFVAAGLRFAFTARLLAFGLAGVAAGGCSVAVPLPLARTGTLSGRRVLRVVMKSVMRGAISARKREPLKTP
jgi:hypothetical protein